MRTKIIVTIGPKTETVETLTPLLHAGVDIVRVNFSHASQAQYRRVRKIVLDFNKKNQTNIGLLLDLQGPRIRAGVMPKEGLTLDKGSYYNFTYSKEPYKADGPIPIDSTVLHSYMKKGQPLFLCNGEISLEVVSIKGKVIRAKVTQAGVLSSHKGINVPSTVIKKGGLTTKDLKDLKFGIKEGVEYVGLSFVQNAADVRRVRTMFGKNSKIKIVSKIERGIALKNIDRIISHSDFIMIARGDLGIEVPIEELPLIQKNLIRHAHWHSVPAIIATQVMTSMISSPNPTRAEVSDIANAVLDGADAIMLSDETSVGDHALSAVKMLNRVIRRTEGFVQKRYFNF